MITAPARDPDLPYRCHGQVTEEMIDEIGHMNMTPYLDFFVHAGDLPLEFAIDESPDGTLVTALVTAEAHVSYRAEAMLGDPIMIDARVADFDEKRIHLLLKMYRGEGGDLLAIGEMLYLNFDMESRRVAPFSPDVASKLRQVAEADRNAIDPAEISRKITIPLK